MMVDNHGALFSEQLDSSRKCHEAKRLVQIDNAILLDLLRAFGVPESLCDLLDRIDKNVPLSI